MTITAFVLAEICSALPVSGSIYVWAAESAGPKYGRFFGFIVAWWSCTAWMTFVASNCQVRFISLFHESKFQTVIFCNRQLRITWYLCLPSMKSTFQVAFPTIMSNGGRSYGPFQKGFSFFQLQSTISPQKLTRLSSNYQLSFI